MIKYRLVFDKDQDINLYQLIEDKNFEDNDFDFSEEYKTKSFKVIEFEDYGDNKSLLNYIQLIYDCWVIVESIEISLEFKDNEEIEIDLINKFGYPESSGYTFLTETRDFQYIIKPEQLDDFKDLNPLITIRY